MTDEDGELEIVQRVLENVHASFYAGKIGDSRDIMQEMRAGVLEGCVIVFSGVIPIGDDVERYVLMLFMQDTMCGSRREMRVLFARLKLTSILPTSSPQRYSLLQLNM